MKEIKRETDLNEPGYNLQHWDDTMKATRMMIDGQECVLVENLFHFDLQQIMESGQCFRIRELPVPKNCDAVRSHSISYECRHVRIDTMRTSGEFVFHCSIADLIEVWYWYFNLDVDYYKIVREILKEHSDPFLEKALEYGSGIRILRQGLYETLLAFLISQNNNIKRITNSINALCERYGERRVDNDIEYITAPDILKLFSADFSGLGLGYREKYFNEMFDVNRASEFSNWFIRVNTSQAPASKELLMQAKGIGNKVADCICLYGLHQMATYPIDTWMKKVIHQVYDGHFDVTPYAECAGYVQQLQFYYFRAKGNS